MHQPITIECSIRAQKTSNYYPQLANRWILRLTHQTCVYRRTMSLMLIDIFWLFWMLMYGCASVIQTSVGDSPLWADTAGDAGLVCRAGEVQQVRLARLLTGHSFARDWVEHHLTALVIPLARGARLIWGTVHDTTPFITEITLSTRPQKTQNVLKWRYIQTDNRVPINWDLLTKAIWDTILPSWQALNEWIDKWE